MNSYIEEVQEDVKTTIGEYSTQALEDALAEPNALDEMRCELQDHDNVSGNMSGSYYCNAEKAKDKVNTRGILWDGEFMKMLEEWGCNLGELVERGAETVDVLARLAAYEWSIDDVFIKNAIVDELEERKKTQEQLAKMQALEKAGAAL